VLLVDSGELASAEEWFNQASSTSVVRLRASAEAGLVEVARRRRSTLSASWVHSAFRRCCRQSRWLRAERIAVLTHSSCNHAALLERHLVQRVCASSTRPALNIIARPASHGRLWLSLWQRQATDEITDTRQRVHEFADRMFLFLVVVLGVAGERLP
jgi:hypothetical protein